MTYKVTIALELWDTDQRDEVLRELRDMLLRTRVTKGKIKTTRTTEIVPGQPLDIAALGVGTAPTETPLEQLARGLTVMKTP
jgi:hypothetical protein